MKRYIVFDTETTGLDPINGDRIIEIGAVELFDKKRTGKTYHQYINPEQKLSDEVIKLTHINDNMLSDKPTFKEIADDFLSFLTYNHSNDNEKENDANNTDIGKTILVAHNASFDLKFLNYQFKLIDKENCLSKFDTIDTLEIARQRFPKQKNSLDILCEKFGISLEQRKKEGHGALLDAQILVDVFINLISDSNGISAGFENVLDFNGFVKREKQLKSRCFSLNEQETKEHEDFLKKNNIDNF